MQRWILAAVVALAGVLVGLAVLLGTRERPPTDVTELPSPDAPQVAVAREHKPLRLDFVPPSAVVSVRVTSEVGGRPLPGVRVGVVLTGRPTAAERLGLTRDSLGRPNYTGPDGVVELGLDPGVAYAIVGSSNDPALMPWSVKVEPLLAADEVRTLDLALPPGRGKSTADADVRLHARVVDRVTGAPIVGARVGRSAGWAAIAPGDEQRTDDDGRFVVDAAPSPRWVRNVIAHGYEPAFVAPIAGHATPERALEIALSRVASARVTVVDANGAPIAGLEASFEAHAYQFNHPDHLVLFASGTAGDPTYRARTDERGVAVFAGLPPNVPLEGRLERGRHEMFRAPEDLTLAPSEAREVTWRVGGGCVVRGVALEANGKPAAGLAVALEPTSYPKPVYLYASVDGDRRFAVSDREGRFAFEDVGPGGWRVGPAPERSFPPLPAGPRDAAARAHFVTVARDARSVDVELRVQRGLTISGRVLEPSGAPVTIGSIEFTRVPEEARSHGSTHGEANGRFVLGPLEEGEHELRATAEGFVASERVVARAGDTDVVLRMRAGGTIAGLVVEKSTGTPCAARFVVSARAPADSLVWVPATDAYGALRHDGLAAGVYDVAAITSSGLVGYLRGVEVAVGATRDVRLEVEPGARIRIRDADSSRHRSVSVLFDGMLVAMDGVPRSREVACVVPAGALVVRMRDHADAQDFDLTVTLKVGETRELVFDGAWK